MISFIKGNIFDSKCQTLVNPVNCVGAMGAGLAKQFANKFQYMYNEYVFLCRHDAVIPGKVYLHQNQDPWVLNFPTKNHWHFPSEYQYIIDGLECFLENYEHWKIESVAFPLLGAGLGGLDPATVKGIMVGYLSHCTIPVEIYETNNY